EGIAPRRRLRTRCGTRSSPPDPTRDGRNSANLSRPRIARSHVYECRFRTEEPMRSLSRRLQSTLFPNRWSRMLAWIVLASLFVTIVSGIYLALYFNPSMSEVTYGGPVDYLRGLMVSRAYASGLDISFDVRGGLFVRQLHSWAASLFIASLLVSLATAFFTGLFPRPPRAAWGVGTLPLPLRGFGGDAGRPLAGLERA